MGKADYPSLDKYMNKLHLPLQTGISKTGELVYLFWEEEHVFGSVTIRQCTNRGKKASQYQRTLHIERTKIDTPTYLR